MGKRLLVFASVLALGVYLALRLLSSPFPPDTTPEGAYMRIAKAVADGDPKAIFAYLETDAQWASYTLRDERKKALEKVRASYPAEERRAYEEAYAPLAVAPDGADVFAILAVQRGWIGVEIQQVTSDIADSLGLKTASGALVAKENKDAPAAAAGVKIGDVITAVNGQSVADPRELARRIADLGPKKSADLTIWRNGAQQTVSVTLGSMPVDQQASIEPPAKPEASASFAKLGLTLEHGADGVTVSDVDPSGVAADRGLQTGDVIIEASGQPVTRPAEIAKAFDTARTDGRKSVLLRVKSGDTVRFIALPALAAS